MVARVYTHVPSEGPRNAKIIVLGEAPWVNECASGRPFAGASGHLLTRWWRDIGLKRTEMYLMNLFPWRPPTRSVGSVPAEKLNRAIEGVHNRLAELTDPYVIVTAGNYATFALTGKGKIKADVRRAFDTFENNVTEAEKKAGITQLRGSIYPYQDLNGRIIKVIPVIDPAAVLQMPKWEKRSITDWKRVKRESEFREIHNPDRKHIVNPTQEDIALFYQRVIEGGCDVVMSVDIETWGNSISCVGFSIDPFESLTIPTIGKMNDNLGWVKVLCESEAQKVLCNGLYDWYWLDAVGIQLVNFLWDVQLMHHALDPAENHSLDYLASIACPHYVFWKDEAKEAEEIIKYAKNLDALFVYNGLDCCYTRELKDIFEKQLNDAGMLNFYIQHYQAMIEPLLRTMRHGMRIDVDAQKSAAKLLRIEMKGIHAKLNVMADAELFATDSKTKYRVPKKDEWDLLLEGASEVDRLNEKPGVKVINRVRRLELIEQGLTYMMSGKNAGKIRYKYEKVKKDFSKDKLFAFFHGKLGLPKMFVLRKGKNGSKKKSPSLDEASLRKLMHKFAKAVEPGKLVLSHRGKKKELDYLRGAYDRDGRMRCSYKLLTNAGRLSSAKNPMRSGLNMQNLKR